MRHFNGLFAFGNMKVRSLRGQPASPSTLDRLHHNRGKPAKYGLSRASRSVSRLQIATTLARICRKSPAKFPDIPIFGRLFAETDFDLHWVVGIPGVAGFLSQQVLRHRQKRDIPYRLLRRTTTFFSRKASATDLLRLLQVRSKASISGHLK